MGSDVLLARRFEWRAAPDDAGDGLTLEGHAAVFGAAYAVADWDGEYDEIVEAGAFKKTLREQGPRVKLLVEHGRHPLIGRIPLGQIEQIREDDHGLFVRAQLHDNWMTQAVADAVRSGSMSEMSIAFRPIRETWEEPTKRGEPRVRRLHEVALREVSVVTWGASPSTHAAVRALVDAMPVEVRSELASALGGGCATCAGGSGIVAVSTPAPAVSDTGDLGAAVGLEPAASVTRQERRRWAAVLRGVTREQQAGAAA